jgi:uncharacterized protein (TIGR02145 family)
MRVFFSLAFLFAITFNVYGQVPTDLPTDGLIGWWDFDGQYQDQNGSGMMFQTNGSTNLGEDRFGQTNAAVQFFGDGSAVATNDGSVEQYGELSVSYWIKRQGGDVAVVALGSSSGGSWKSVFGTSCGIRYADGCGNGSQGFVSGSGAFQGAWHHVVMTTHGLGQQFSVYVDGELLGVANAGGGGSCSTTAIHLGVEIWSAPEYLIGFIDDLGIWNRQLTSEEVAQLYGMSSTSGCTDDAACNFDQDANVDDGSCIPSGCMDTDACNFNSEAECEGEVCDYTCCPGPGCCNEGTFWDEVTQTCIVTNPTDTNFDGCTDLNDLMDILAAYGDCALVEFASCGDLLEYQGYDYETVQIGEQCWFAENLRAENYTDGTSIPLNSIENHVSGPNPNYKCFYGDDLSNVAENGMLYSWFASADSRGICPVGWHLPSLTDFEALTQEVGGVSNAGSALKAVHPTWNGNDDYGFTAIPSGYFNWVNAPYSSDPSYFFMGSHAYYWSSESTGSNSAYYMILWSDQNSASLLPSNGNFAEDAMSVRCIKD